MADLALGILGADPAEGERLAAFFVEHGFGVVRFAKIEDLLGRLAIRPPHLVLICTCNGDVATAGAALRRLRAESRLPAVILGGVNDIGPVTMLDAGADDVLDRVLPLRAILARLRAILRRAEWGLSQGSRTLTVNGWRLLAERRQLLRPDGTECPLTTAEFDLLQLLLERRGRAVDRDTIAENVFHRPFRVEDRTVDNLVLRLRRKLGDTGQVAVKTVRGAGYMFVGFRDEESGGRRVA
ncbi:MAG: response regulator transcription factor [Acetobacteraceae bacterium]|nr:response regulator transcription factor [Acetobacteraceae bacterium]